MLVYWEALPSAKGAQNWESIAGQDKELGYLDMNVTSGAEDNTSTLKLDESRELT